MGLELMPSRGPGAEAEPAWRAEGRRDRPGGKGRVGSSHREGGPAILKGGCPDSNQQLQETSSGCKCPGNGTKKQKSNGTRVPTGWSPCRESGKVDETVWTLASRGKPQDWSRGKGDEQQGMTL